MSFDGQLKAWAVKVESRTKAVFLSTAMKMHESITVGSPVTASPGQPVDTGFLRASWIIRQTPTEAVISTPVSYAPVIEHNLRSSYDPKGVKNERKNPNGSFRRPIKSTVGGNHSVKLTVAGADRLQAEALRELGD